MLATFLSSGPVSWLMLYFFEACCFPFYFKNRKMCSYTFVSSKMHGEGAS
jgi:hypothetical protein